VLLRILILVSTALTMLVRAADEPLALTTALEKKRVQLKANGNGRDTITVEISKATADPLAILIPAGTRFAAEDGEIQVTLRDLKATVTASAEAILPAAALSSRNTATQRALTVAADAEPRISKLLELFASQNDLPRPTAQLAIFIVLEDLGWAEWKKWMEPVWSLEKQPKPHPTPSEIAQAVDAIAFARLAAPDRKFKILADEHFKRLALRNPWARGKAMALYGLTVEDAITGDTSLPPDLGKLLHTSPNDNCPICRQRQKEPAEIP
jgi:hypothetical protein